MPHLWKTLPLARSDATACASVHKRKSSQSTVVQFVLWCPLGRTSGTVPDSTSKAAPPHLTFALNYPRPTKPHREDERRFIRSNDDNRVARNLRSCTGILDTVTVVFETPGPAELLLIAFCRDRTLLRQPRRTRSSLCDRRWRSAVRTRARRQCVAFRRIRPCDSWARSATSQGLQSRVDSPPSKRSADAVALSSARTACEQRTQRA